MWGAPALLEQAHAGDPDNQCVIPDLANVSIDLGEFDSVRNGLDSAPGSVESDAKMRTVMARLAIIRC